MIKVVWYHDTEKIMVAYFDYLCEAIQAANDKIPLKYDASNKYSLSHAIIYDNNEFFTIIGAWNND